MPQRHTVLITGASGMLGMDLASELASDYDVYGTDIVKKPKLHLKKFFKADIAAVASISRVMKSVRPDIVIHAAAWTDVDGCELDRKKAFRINANGTRNVAHASRSVGAVVIYLSTDFVFAGQKRSPYRTSDKPAPLSVYGASKLAGEKAIKAISGRHFIVRTSWLYGAEGKNFVDTIRAKAKVEPELKVVTDQVGSPTYTKDLSKAIKAILGKLFSPNAVRHTQYGTYHFSNSGSVSWYRYAKEIVRLSQGKAKVLPISSALLARPAKRPALSVMDCSKITEFVGHKPRAWECALAEYIKRYPVGVAGKIGK